MASQLTFWTQTSVFLQPRAWTTTSGSLGPIYFRYNLSWKIYVNPYTARLTAGIRRLKNKGHIEAYLRAQSSSLKWGFEGPHVCLLSANSTVGN